MTTGMPGAGPSGSGSASPSLATSLAHANAAAPSGGATIAPTMLCASAARRQEEQRLEQQMSDQIDAIRNLGHSGFFPHLNTAAVADQLEERVVLPYRVNQGNTGFCGAAAFTSTLAELRPAEYVQLAHDLMFLGEGRVGNLQVKPGSFVRGLNPADAHMADADWLVLASIRNDTNGALLRTDPGHYGGTRTSDVHRWLKDAGFKHVHYIGAAEKYEPGPGGKPWALRAMYDEVDAALLHTWHPSRPGFLSQKTASELATPSQNMNLAKQFLANDWTVIGQVSEKYANSGGNSGAAQAIAQLEAAGAPPATIAQMRKQLEEQMVGEGTNHWAVIREATVRQGDDGRMYAGIKRYSWGTEEHAATLPMDQYKKMYGGFIAVSDDANALSKWRR